MPLVPSKIRERFSEAIAELDEADESIRHEIASLQRKLEDNKIKRATLLEMQSTLGLSPEEDAENSDDLKEMKLSPTTANCRLLMAHNMSAIQGVGVISRYVPVFRVSSLTLRTFPLNLPRIDSKPQPRHLTVMETPN